MGEHDTPPYERQRWTERRRDEERLRLLEAVVAQTTDLVIITEATPLDAPGPRIVYVNAAFTCATGYMAAEVIGRTPRLLQGPETERAPLDTLHAALARHEPVSVTVRNYRKDGTPFWSEMSVAPVADAHGRVTHFVAVQRDVTARREAEDALRATRERFRAFCEHTSDMIAVLDATNIVRYASPATARILGYTPEELEGRSAATFVDPTDLAQAQAMFAAHLCEPGSVRRIEFRVRHRDGSWRMTETIATNRLHDPAVRGILLTSRDITDRKRAEEALRHQALHDALTGLPNRVLLRDRLELALHAAVRAGTPLALLVLDLDGFKRVNDTRGHDEGDRLLRVVADRLRVTLRAADTVARLGGDEFCALLPGDTAAGATETALALLAALSAPIVLEGWMVTVGASVGIALSPDHGMDAATLLRRADAAMYAAKRAGGGYALAAGVATGDGVEFRVQHADEPVAKRPGSR